MRSGGRYRKTKGGKVEQTQPPTQDHPRGNCARDAKGQALAASVRAREADKKQPEEK